MSLPVNKRKKNKQMGLHQTESFYRATKTTNKTKRKTTEWKIFAIDTSNKGLISQIYKMHTMEYQGTNNPIKKVEESLNKHFSKRTYR